MKKLKQRASFILQELKLFIEKIEYCHLTNEQWYLDFEDRLNELSVKDHGIEEKAKKDNECS